VNKWQPIETAPKAAGVQVLLAGDGYGGTGYVVSGYYDEDRDGWWEANTHWTDAADGQVYPTHWMPLPAPPTTSDGNQK
jgi:hypothetical protein